jgi:hypothetical protein
MLPQSISISYLDSLGKRRSRNFAGLRKDLTDEQIKDFALNSEELTGFLEVTNAVITTKRTLV